MIVKYFDYITKGFFLLCVSYGYGSIKKVGSKIRYERIMLVIYKGEVNMNELQELPYSDDELDFFCIYGDYTTCFAVPIGTNGEMIKRLMAAMKSYNLGYKKIDYVYNNYAHKWDFSERKKDSKGLLRAHEILVPHLKVMDNLDIAINSIEESLNIGRFAIVAGVTRLRNTFRSIHSLIAKGYHIEAIALIRLLLEQTAWYYEIYENEDGDFFNIKPHKSIKELKKFIPVSGQLYGKLSKYTHVMPSTTLDFLELKKETQDGDRIDHVIHFSNDRYRYKSMRLYFYTILIFFKVINKVFQNYKVDFDFDEEKEKVKQYIEDITLCLKELDNKS